MACLICHKAFKVGYKQCKSCIFVKLLIIFSKNGIFVSAIEEKMIDTVARNPKILHTTTASSYSTPPSNGTIRFLNQNFVNRLKSDKDVWLFGLDISVHAILNIREV